MIKIFGIFLLLIFCNMSLVNAQSGTSNHLDKKQESIISVAGLTGKGDLKKLPKALNAGLDNSLTINQIKEILIQVYAYAGFPRSLQGIQTFMKVIDDRKAKGINDIEGNFASPIVSDSSKYQRGKAILERLTGVQESGTKKGYAAFTPTIEIFLKEHLFADIFERDVLTFQERELVTISILASIGNVEPMLRSHLGICLRLGITENQLEEFAKIIHSTIGKSEAETANHLIKELLKQKK